MTLWLIIMYHTLLIIYKFLFLQLVLMWEGKILYFFDHDINKDAISIFVIYKGKLYIK